MKGVCIIAVPSGEGEGESLVSGGWVGLIDCVCIHCLLMCGMPLGGCGMFSNPPPQLVMDYCLGSASDIIEGVHSLSLSALEKL